MWYDAMVSAAHSGPNGPDSQPNFTQGVTSFYRRETNLRPVTYLEFDYCHSIPSKFTYIWSKIKAFRV